jgi:hypothetical protein
MQLSVTKCWNKLRSNNLKVVGQKQSDKSSRTKAVGQEQSHKSSRTKAVGQKSSDKNRRFRRRRLELEKVSVSGAGMRCIEISARRTDSTKPGTDEGGIDSTEPFVVPAAGHKLFEKVVFLLMTSKNSS